jgi:hypothetical protein
MAEAPPNAEAAPATRPRLVLKPRDPEAAKALDQQRQAASVSLETGAAGHTARGRRGAFRSGGGRFRARARARAAPVPSRNRRGSLCRHLREALEHPLE